MILLLLLLAAQAKTLTCSGSGDERNCSSEDGTTYVERRLAGEVVRQGTSPDGTSWTEYLTHAFDGVRLEGSDTEGHHWSQQCNPRYGTTGTDRNGHSVYIPPPPRVRLKTSRDEDRFNAVSNPIGNEQPSADACQGL